MIYREKVLKALEHHKETAVCNGCPYADDDDTPQGYCPIYDDVIALLTDTTSWIKEPNRRNHWHCEKCGSVVSLTAWMYTYCPVCGRKVIGEIEFDA